MIVANVADFREAVGIPLTLSTASACPLGEVTAAATKPIWFQLYMIRDRAFMKDLLGRAWVYPLTGVTRIADIDKTILAGGNE